MTDTDPPASDRRPEKILVCINRRYGDGRRSCAGSGSEALADALADGIRARRIDVVLERSVCMGQCLLGPTVRFAPGGRFNLGTRLEDVSKLLDELEKLCGVRSIADDPPWHLLGS